MAHEIIIPLNSSNVPNLRRNFDFVCKSPENLKNAVVRYGIVPYQSSARMHQPDIWGLT